MNHSNHPPPADIDAMLYDVSNQMARSQIFRRLSANSKNSSPSSRKGNTRVFKPHSSGGTPNGVQRRKTTAAHASRHHGPPTPMSGPSQQSVPTVAQRVKHNGSASTARPMTWHPGIYSLQNCPQELQSAHSSYFPPSMIYQDPIWTDSTDYAPQFSFDPSLSWEPQYQNATVTLASQSTIPDYPSAYSVETPTYHPASHDYVTQLPQQDINNTYGYDPCYTSGPTSDPFQVLSDNASYSAQQTPNSFPNQYPLDPPQYVRDPVPSHITKQRSKELIGMGLYDGPGRKELLALDASPHHISQLLAEPQGKGLKLEETWQPPNEDGDDNEDEAYSTDEAEDDLPAAPASTETQRTYISAYGDLSNQSFFFENDDPYTACMSFDQAMKVCPPKASDLPNQNLMWF
ncbi:MAG: hypothetical protein Q9201_002060 [Fulgogasparrea decipioides]